MLDVIHQSKILSVMEKRKDGHPVPFSMQYVKRSTGELKTCASCVLCSVHSKGATVNILMDKLDAPHKIRRCLITKINGLKVYF